MRNKKFTIIVPMYNVERWIEECIQSIVNQNYSDTEIILINDGSTDSTLEIATEMCNRDNRIILINQENKGISAARNVGLERATGEYVLFVDSDDWIYQGILTTLSKLVESRDVISFRYNENGQRKVPFEKSVFQGTGEEYVRNNVEMEGFVPVWRYCYRRKFLNENRFKFKEGIIHEDEIWTPTVLLRANKIMAIDFVGYYYRFRDGSIVRNKNINKKANTYIEISEEMNSYFQRNKLKNRELACYYEQKIMSFFLRGILMKLELGQKKEAKQLLSEHTRIYKKKKSIKNLKLMLNVYIKFLLLSLKGEICVRGK